MLPILPTFGFMLGLITFLFVAVCLFMMLVILIQKPRGGGLTGAFGGAGGSASSVFGAKTGDVLTWFTCVCFVLFILLAMALTWVGKPGARPVDNIIAPPPSSNPFGSGPTTPTTPTTPGGTDSLLPSDRLPVTPGPTTPETPKTPATPEAPAKDAAPKTDPDAK